MTAAATIRLEPEREERLRGLLVEFALGTPSGKYFFVEEMEALHVHLRQLLGEITALRGQRDTLRSYIERLEAANSTLHLQFADEQTEREALVEQGAIMLGEFSEWFQKINALRGKGTPRAIPRIATDSTPRIAAGAHRG